MHTSAKMQCSVEDPLTTELSYALLKYDHVWFTKKKTNPNILVAVMIAVFISLVTDDLWAGVSRSAERSAVVLLLDASGTWSSCILSLSAQSLAVRSLLLGWLLSFTGDLYS